MKKNGTSAREQAESKTGTQELKRITLKKQVIAQLYRSGPQTIADACKSIHVSIPTMASVMNELKEGNWVNSFGMANSRGGRRPVLYGLADTNRFIAGLEISRHYTRMAVFNLHNKLICRVTEINQGLETSPDILTIIKKEIEAIFRKHQLSKEHILAYGITIPGLIDTRKGICFSFGQLGIQPVAETFSKLLNGPAIVENDTNAMAIGESWFGLAKNKTNVLCLNIGSGIGMGIIMYGTLYKGHTGFSGEFGHIHMIADGELCYCGKFGCLETIASGTAMVRKAINRLESGQDSTIRAMVNGQIADIKMAHIIRAGKKGDQFAIELIEQAGEYLARGIATLIHLFNPEAIIIGGDIVPAGRLITDTIQQKLNKYTMSQLRKETTILLSNLKESAGLLGTVPMVMTNMFSNGAESKMQGFTGL